MKESDEDKEIAKDVAVEPKIKHKIRIGIKKGGNDRQIKVVAESAYHQCMVIKGLMVLIISEKVL